MPSSYLCWPHVLVLLREVAHASQQSFQRISLEIARSNLEACSHRNRYVRANCAQTIPADPAVQGRGSYVTLAECSWVHQRDCSAIPIITPVRMERLKNSKRERVKSKPSFLPTGVWSTLACRRFIYFPPSFRTSGTRGRTGYLLVRVKQEETMRKGGWG